MKRFHLFAVLLVFTLGFSAAGCNREENVSSKSGETQNATSEVEKLKRQLEGSWKVTKWICDSGKGPFNFERNIGWKFNFTDDGLELDKLQKESSKFKVTLDPSESPARVCLVLEMDIDEDGEIDLSLQRNCLVKFDKNKLIMVYGSASTNVSLNTGKAESTAGFPTRFVADKNGSLLTLEKVE